MNDTLRAPGGKSGHAPTARVVIGADLRRNAAGQKAERLLEAFRGLLATYPDARLVLALRRSRGGISRFRTGSRPTACRTA